MSESYEVAIRDLLLGVEDSAKVAESLVKRLKAESPNRQERIAFVNFLIEAGYESEVLELYGTWFKERKRIPLTGFCLLLHRSGFQPGAEFLKFLFQAVENLKVEKGLTHFIPWETLDSRFVEMKAAAIENLHEQARERKKNLLEKLEYFRLNSMIEEEERLLTQLAELYPDDESLRKNQDGFQERWARAIIAKKAIEKFDTGWEWTEPEIEPAQLVTLQAIVGEMTDLVHRKDQPEGLAYDFAVGLCFLELYENARQMLELAPQSLAVDWLYIDVLLKCRRYVEGLDALLNLETRYASDPETTFGVTYYRALALEGLGQIPVAIELIRSLVAIRPGYRSAHSLLLKWGGR